MRISTMKFWTSLCTCYRTIRNGDLHRHIHLEILEKNSPLAMPATFWIQCKLYTLHKRKIAGRSIYIYITNTKFQVVHQIFPGRKKRQFARSAGNDCWLRELCPFLLFTSGDQPAHFGLTPDNILSVWSMFCKYEYHSKLELKYWRKFCGKFRAMAK